MGHYAVVRCVDSAKMKRAEQGRQSLSALSTMSAVKEQNIMSERDSICAPEENPVEYRDIAGFPGYRIGNDGTVWSCRVRGPGNNLGSEWRLITGGVSSRGYQILTLCDGSSQRYRAVHRLVLEAFVGPCPDGMEACHFPNPDRTCNVLSNLRWDTKKANGRDRVAHGTSLPGSKNPSAVLTLAMVEAIRDEFASGGVTRVAIARKYNVTPTTISNIINRKCWK